MSVARGRVGGRRAGGGVGGWEVEKPTQYYRQKYSKSSHNEPRPLHSVKQTSINGWGEFEVHPVQLVPPVGAICSDVTSQGQQTAVRKSRLVNLG